MKNKKNITGLLGGGNTRLIKRFFALGLVTILTFTSTTSYAAVRDNTGTSFDSYEDMIIETTDITEDGDYALIGIPNDGLYNTDSKLQVSFADIVTSELFDFTEGEVIEMFQGGTLNSGSTKYSNLGGDKTYTLDAGTYLLYSYNWNDSKWFAKGAYSLTINGEVIYSSTAADAKSVCKILCFKEDNNTIINSHYKYWTTCLDEGCGTASWASRKIFLCKLK